ncbi:hypothetical protein R0K05_09325 [Planococcus sp. SIMBA_160]
MKTSNRLFLFSSFFALVLLLVGCMNASASQTLTINSLDSYEGVLVSEASSVVKTDGYEEKFVSGKDKANDLMAILDGKELIEATEQELQERTDELEEPGNYRVLLYNKPSVNSTSQDMYLILFYEDGAIQVNQEASTYFIADPPEDLLNQLKRDWDIAF